MDIDALRQLLDLERHGSLTALARHHDVAVSTVARRLDALEAALGLRLLDRRANGVRLTAEGQRIAALALPLVDQAARIDRAATALRATSSGGMITISATEYIVSETLAPALPDLRRTAPALAVTLRSQGEVVSLAAREADLAIRMSRPTEPSLFARKIAELPLGLFASTAYLAGRDVASVTLGEERLLVYDDSYGHIAELDWVAVTGLTGAVMLRTGSTRALINACAAGAGIALLPVRAAARAGLVAVPAPFALASRGVWLLTHRDIRRLPAVRAASAWIVRCFATER
ncbi:MAG: LysR family transcriptional regulator [Sphingomonas sp.]|nr:LysR family transcriptional regulator [Sphingomonas sp.]